MEESLSDHVPGNPGSKMKERIAYEITHVQYYHGFFKPR